jgi:periplasmic divalent cation tolerance protein
MLRFKLTCYQDAHKRRIRNKVSAAANSSGEGDMPEPASTVRIVLTTTADPEEASRLGRVMVEERLAACATLVPAAQSIYRWQGQIETAGETLLLLKTEAAQVAALEARLQALHSYETPEFLVFTVESASHAYLEWLRSCLRADA